MLTKAAWSKSLTWLDLRLNPGLPDDWWTLYSLGKWGQKHTHTHTHTHTHIYIYIYIYIYIGTFIDSTHMKLPLRSNLLQLQCTCCNVPTIFGRPRGSPLVWACQWPSSKPLSPPQLSQRQLLSLGNNQKS